MGNEKYIIQTICSANVCRSRMAQGILRDLIEKASLEELVEVKSSGMNTDKIRKWGAGEYLSIDAILKVLDAAYNNAVLVAQYLPFVEEVLADKSLTKERHDNDASFKDRLNTIASEVYKVIAQLDMASTILAMAEHGVIYPIGEPRQFREDGSKLYVPMEKKFVKSIKEQVSNPQSVRCFDEFTPGMEMKGSLAAIHYKDGKLDIIDFRKIYEQIELGCRNLMQTVELE
jgi:hypothetical protein